MSRSSPGSGRGQPPLLLTPTGRSSGCHGHGTYVPLRTDDKSTTAMEQDDNGYYLRVVATYTDVTSDSDMMTTDSVDERTSVLRTRRVQLKTFRWRRLTDDGDGTGVPTPTMPLYRQALPVMTTSKNAVRVAPTLTRPRWQLPNSPPIPSTGWWLRTRRSGLSWAIPSRWSPSLMTRARLRLFTYDIDRQHHW